MKSFRWLALAAALLAPTLALADAIGSPTGGVAASQSMLAGCVYTTPNPALANGQQVGVQCDSTGALRVAATVNASSAGLVATSNPTYANGTTQPFSLDTSGNLRVTGTFTSGSTTNGAAVPAGGQIVGGSDGTNFRFLSTDANGRLNVQGPFASGTSLSSVGGVMIGGSDGTNYRHLSTTTAGVLNVTGVTAGAAANGAAVSGNPVLIAGSDGTNARTLLTTATGALNVVHGTTNGLNVQGGIAAGATDGGNPVKVGGVYNSTLPTYTTGQRGDLQITAKGGLLSTLVDSTGNLVTARFPSADATAMSGAAHLDVAGVNYLWNGTNFDRQRDANGAAATTGTGLTGAGQLVFDGTNWQKAKGDSAGSTNVNAGAVSTGVAAVPQTESTAAINVATATTTQLVALSAAKKIYVTHWNALAAGTGNLTFVYGTGASCGTGTTSLTGAYNLTAQAGVSAGGGYGAVLVVPASNALCVTTSAAVQMSGVVAYTQY